MPVSFKEFSLHNRNGVQVTVTLEAPIGSEVVTGTVGPNATRVFPVNVNDVQTTRVTVVEASHGPRPDVQAINVERSGNPFEVYIVSLKATTNIGSIRGELATSF